MPLFRSKQASHGGTGRQGRPESSPGRMDEQSYDPIVPEKVENRRAMPAAVAATLSTGGKGGTSRRLE